MTKRSKTSHTLGATLQFASERLRGTKDIVVAAVGQDWSARELATFEMHEDVKAAARENAGRQVRGGAAAVAVAY